MTSKSSNRRTQLLNPWHFHSSKSYVAAVKSDEEPRARSRKAPNLLKLKEEANPEEFEELIGFKAISEMDQKLIQGLYDSDFADEVPNPIATAELIQNRSDN